MIRQTKTISIVIILLAAVHCLGQVSGKNEPLTLASPLVGTAIYAGAMYPGAALPFSMVKLSPDTTKPSSAGYNPAQPIVGFSHTHIGGTGGATFDGQIRVRPQTGTLNVSPAASPKANEVASPGYYAVDLTADRAHVELTAAEWVGFHRYTFPAGVPGRVLIDLAAIIDNGRPDRPAGVCTGSAARFISDRVVEGQTSIKAGLASLTYTIYFVAEFDQSATARGVWHDKFAEPGTLEVKGAGNQPAGIYAEFAPGAVNLRVGISNTSVEQAREHMESIKALGFDEVRSRAEGIWWKHFSKITVEGGTDTQRRQFYTALYHTVLTPTDVTGDNNHWAADAKQPVYWDIHTLWDTFRSADPLRILIYPERERAIIGSLLAVYRKTGWLPDAWCYNKHSIGFQGGTHADNVIADATVKKLGGFDADLAYAAVRKNASEANPKVSKSWPGTGRLPPYFTLGYVPSSVYAGKDAKGEENFWSNGVSRTLEYSYNDFSVSQVAAALGKSEDAAKFRTQSLNAYKLFHPDKRLFWGKTATGEWIPDFDAKKLTMGAMNTFYEGSAWQYQFSMPHDLHGLIDRCGGDAAFVSILDEYFDTGLHYAGNEPGFLTPWLYIYAGRPDKAADRVRAILAKNFKVEPDGYPGDEDVGAMSAWYIFAAMGFFPNAGQDVYLLSTPVFNKTTLNLGSSGKTFVVSAMKLSDDNRYVQSATLNGKPWDRAWFRHADIIDGAELVLTMGPKPSKWGAEDRPPSLSTVVQSR